MARLAVGRVCQTEDLQTEEYLQVVLITSMI
jgi:hypothetical protein